MKIIDGERHFTSRTEQLVLMFLDEVWEDYTRLDGVQIAMVHAGFDKWRERKNQQKPSSIWNVSCNKIDFTRKVKKLRAIESTRRRINGKQVPVFVVENPEAYKREKEKMAKAKKQTLKELEVRRYVNHCINKKKRIIGVPTEKLWLDYTGWLCDSKYWRYEASQREFTMWVKSEMKCETVRKMIHGKQVPVFWDSGATRLDLGTYLN